MKKIAYLFLLFLPFSAQAQEFFNAYHVPSYALNASANVVSGYYLRDVLFNKKGASGSTGSHGKRHTQNAQANIDTSFVPAKNSATLSNMAALAPAAQQQPTLQSLTQALSSYKTLEKTLGLPKNDVASGLAAFLAGNYMAYHNTSVPNQTYKTLVKQMRLVLAATPKFRNASNAEKQTIYEQMASLGMVMAVAQYSLAKNPNEQTALQMKQTAKQIFEGFFKMDIDQIRITEQGLSAS